MNQRKAGTILSYLHIFITNTISLIYTPYMLRIMGQSEYGLYGAASSFITYLSVLGVGIGGAYIRFNAIARSKNDRTEEKRLNGMFLLVFFVLSLLVLIGGVILIVFAGSLVENTFTEEELFKLRIIMIVLTLNMMLTFIFNVVMMALQAYEKYICIRGVLLVAGIITPIINVIALEHGGRAIAISLITLFVSLLSYLFFYIYARKAIKLEFLFRNFDKKTIRELFVFSGFLFLNAITDQITFATDNIVLSAVKGTSAVAVYVIGANFRNYFLNFSSSVASVFAPQVNRIVANNEDMTILNELFVRIGRVQFYIVSLILIGYLSIGKSFVTLWAGDEYVDAYYIGLVLMISVFVPAFQNIGIEIQKAKNMHKARSIVYFFIAIVNVILTIPFSVMWGGIGAAIATLICLFAGTVVFMNIYYHKCIGLDMRLFWKSILSIVPGYVVPVLMGIYINRCIVIDSYLNVLGAVIALTASFAISVWILSFNAYEKNLIMKPIQRLLKRGNKI